MSHPIAVVDMALGSPYEPLDDPSIRSSIERIDCYDLPSLDLTRYAGLVAEGMVDQEFLYRHRGQVADYLAHGGPSSSEGISCGRGYRGRARSSPRPSDRSATTS